MDYERPYDDILNFFLDQYDLDSYNGGNIRLSYIDDDQDEITMSSNREVADALNSLSKTSDCIKLKIKDKDYTDESGSDTCETQVPEGETKVETEETIPATGEPVSDLQTEIDNIITGIRHSKIIGEEPVTVKNIFTSFQGKPKRQFELEEDQVHCKVCPVGRTMEPSTDLQLIRAHARSDLHMMALTYHVLGDWPVMPQYLSNNHHYELKTENKPEQGFKWRNLDNTAAQLLAVKYHQLGKPPGQRRKRTSFSPATTLALEQFANSINWKRGESDKINEFAQKHGLTFYQVKVWMNNHRPRKAVMHPGHYMNQANNFYGMNGTGTDHAREINKVIAALEEPLQQKLKAELNSSTIPTTLGLFANPLSPSSLLSPPLHSSVSGLLSTSLASSIGSLVSSLPLTSSPSNNFFSSSHSRFSSLSPFTTTASSPFSLPTFSTSAQFSIPSDMMTSSLGQGLGDKIKVEQAEASSPKSDTSSFSPPDMKLEPFSSLPKPHPISIAMDTVSLDSAFRPPTFSNNPVSLHFNRPGQESMGSGT